MLTPGKYPLRIISGADFDFTFRYKLGDSPVVLDGLGFEFQVRKAPGEATVLALSLGEGITVGEDSWVTVFAPASVTELIAPGSYMYAVEVTSASGRVDRLLVDRLTVDPDVIS